MNIHWFSPLPPSATEIASHSARLLPVLAGFADITCWTAQDHWEPWLDDYARIQTFGTGPLDWEILNRADATYFNIGNNARYHQSIWNVCRHYAGIVILHDVLLHEFFRGISSAD